MPQTPFIFNQLMSFIPRDTFDRLVKKHGGNAHVKNYSCWNHLLVMVWAQLTGRQSLRDIEASLRAHSDNLYRMGIGRSVSRNSIANANARRDVAIFRGIAQEMMGRCMGIASRDPALSAIGKSLGINGFFAIDSSTVSLKLSKFPWSAPQKGWGGVKLHTMFDLLRGVPRMCLITGHEARDQTFMEDYPYEEGCFYIFDRMYFKAKGLCRVQARGAYFVTRIKRGVVYETVGSSPVTGPHVLADETIRFGSRWASSGYPGRMRLVKYYSAERNELLRFVTNDFAAEASAIALLYKHRWQIGLFFRWIKQHLRITAFYGTSANAVMIQIYTAFVSFCSLALAADGLDFKGSLYEFANMVSVSLTERCHLRDLLARYRQETPPRVDSLQLNLFDD